MTAFRHFSEIHAWQTAKSVAVAAYRLTEQAPIGRDFGLRDQVRRAAVSVMSNIAEGFGRGRDRQFSYFLDIARGSSAELESLLILVAEIHPHTADEIDPIRSDLNRTTVLIAKLSQYLRTSESSAPLDDRTTGRPDDRTV